MATHSMIIDVGHSVSVAKIFARANSLEFPNVVEGFSVAASDDGSTWTNIAGLDANNIVLDYTLPTPVTKRYWRLSLFNGICDVQDMNQQVADFELFPPADATATHTTAPTQIDGGANFWQWENFTDTKTVPANTSVSYRYRTSTNATDWTGWVGSIGAVTSRTGDDSNNPTKYRYLQIEATLSNTDGASTPTIDQYDIGYHTNQPPNKPTAMTAVIQ